MVYVESCHMKVSLYIPCYKVAEHIVRCLTAVVNQNRPADEIMIIDDGSPDDTVEIVRARFPSVRIIQHDVNRGLAAARNTALHNASHELVAALDADTAPQPQWLENMLPHFDDESIAVGCGPLYEQILDTMADRWRQATMTQAWGDQPIRNPRFIFGNNTVIRRSAALEVGGYNTAFRTNGEDSDMTNRLREVGYDTFYEPGAVVHHFRRDTQTSVFDTRWRYYFSGSKLHTDPPGWRTALRHMPTHFKAHFRYLRKKRKWRINTLPLLWLDVQLPFYLSYREWRYFVKDWAKDPARIAQSNNVC